MKPAPSTPAIAIVIFTAAAACPERGGAAGIGLAGAAVNGTPSTDFPQRQVKPGGATRRPHAAHARVSPWGAVTDIYEEILT
jgi:hypothetical protein